MTRTDAFEALHRIEEVANHLAATIALVESQVRILVRKLPTPPDVPEPQWFQAALEDALADAPEEPSPRLLRTVSSFAGLTSTVIGPAAALLTVTSHGAIEMAWEHYASLRCLIYPSKLSWPGALIRLFHAPDPRLPRLSDRLFWTAQTALQHIEELNEA